MELLGQRSECMNCQINKIQKEKGQWVEVVFPNGWHWIPSFEEISTILNLIGQCEDDRYINGKGADMVIEFCKDAIIGIPYEELKKKFQLPK